MGKPERARLTIEGTLARLTLTRGDKHNGVDLEMIEQTIAIASKLKKNKTARAVVIEGEGPSFCAGLDFKSVFGKPLVAATSYASLLLPARNIFQKFSMVWREVPLPVFALIHGNCFGAGLQLALGCDFRICTPDATLSVLEAKWGLIPDMGGMVLLREVVSMDVAKELTFTGRMVLGEEAKQLGLVTYVDANPLERAKKLIAELETRSPDSIAVGKRLLQESWTADEELTLALERRSQRALIGGKNQRISFERNNKKTEIPFAPRSHS